MAFQHATAENLLMNMSGQTGRVHTEDKRAANGTQPYDFAGTVICKSGM